MRNHTRLIQMSLILLGLIVAGCGPVADVIGERNPPTPTTRPFSTATPGGQLSVWLVTPTGVFSGQEITPTPLSPAGNPVGPAATATSAMATIQAATQIAAAPPDAPYYQPNECPQPGSPAPPPRPQDFNDFSVKIARFLSAGGSSPVLEAALRNWGAITDQGGVVQADTDLTGDGVLEVIVTLFNPTTYNPEAIRNAGQLLVYGCDSGGYRLLYSTPFNSGIALPVLLRVGDMNADVRNELVFYSETCNGTNCYKESKILTWNAIVGVFEELNNGQIVAINGKIGIADLDEDGVLELSAQINQPGSASAGPPRSLDDIWDWNGLDYVLALRQEEGPRYRIHAVYAADDLLRAGSLRDAITTYAEMRDNTELLAWSVANETGILRAYGAYRIVIAYAALGNGRANDWLTTLLNENPPGAPGYPFAQMGETFMNNFRATNDTRAACAEAMTVAAAQPEVLGALNSYGTANRTYTLGDLCPF